MIKRLLLFCSLLLVTGCSVASNDSLELKVLAEKSFSAEEFLVVPVQLKIPANQHLYANQIGTGTGKATVLQTNSLKSSNFYYPQGTRIEEDASHYVYIYENQVICFWELPLKFFPQELEIKLSGLLCDDHSCLPVNLSWRGQLNQPVKEQSAYQEEYLRLKKKAFVEQKIKNPKKEQTLNALAPQSTVEPLFTEKYSTSEFSNLASQSQTEKTTFLDSKSFAQFEARFPQEHSVNNLLKAILFGLLAGFILNFMPCVLPVISLKLLGFVKQGENNLAKTRAYTFSFAAGILFSFLILASLAAFAGHSWGELFQSRAFLLSMIFLVFAFALSLFGVYQISVPSLAAKASSKKVRNNYADSFFKGMLATLLATPCSGPFLGGVLAWTLFQPSFVIFIVFLCIGLGMSLPYFIVGLRPQSLKRFPRSGPWLDLFEKFLGLLLIATAIYLINILPATEIKNVLWFLLLVTVAFLQFGYFGSKIRSSLSRIISSSFLVIIIISAGLFLLKPTKQTESLSWQNFTTESFLAAQKTEQVIVVDFTADWCPNCKFVEQTVLQNKKIVSLLLSEKAILFKADLTKADSQGEALLHQLGSKSIPFLAVFPPGSERTKPLCLRDVYSTGDFWQVWKEQKKLN